MNNYKDSIDKEIQRVTSREGLNFTTSFLMNRNINREYFMLVPEDKFDTHLVSDKKVQSDSPRKNIKHQIDTTRDYICGIKTGLLKFRRDEEYVDLQNPELLSKQELIDKLDESTIAVIITLQNPDIESITVTVPWSKVPILALQMIWGLNNHEILHTGWNLAYMDFLHIPRFFKLKAMWG